MRDVELEVNILHVSITTLDLLDVVSETLILAFIHWLVGSFIPFLLFPSVSHLLVILYYFIVAYSLDFIGMKDIFLCSVVLYRRYFSSV